jgi:hypothetical protein
MFIPTMTPQVRHGPPIFPNMAPGQTPTSMMPPGPNPGMFMSSVLQRPPTLMNALSMPHLP